MPELTAICPGSFDPITLGHENLVRRAARFADHVIVAVGHSPTQEKSGLLDVEARVRLIEEVFADEPGIVAASFQGLLVDFARERGAMLIVKGVRGVRDFEYEMQMGQMNRHLEEGIETLLLPPDPRYGHISSTLVRQIHSLGGSVEGLVPVAVARRLAG